MSVYTGGERREVAEIARAEGTNSQMEETAGTNIGGGRGNMFGGNWEPTNKRGRGGGAGGGKMPVIIIE